MKCCQEIDDSLAKAIADHDTLMKMTGDGKYEGHEAPHTEPLKSKNKPIAATVGGNRAKPWSNPPAWNQRSLDIKACAKNLSFVSTRSRASCDSEI